jgi:7-cyano-7-deazaguanine synthase in queuosine biosynthesis
MGKEVLILLSGGIDSTGCTHYYIGEGYDMAALQGIRPGSHPDRHIG